MNYGPSLWGNDIYFPEEIIRAAGWRSEYGQNQKIFWKVEEGKVIFSTTPFRLSLDEKIEFAQKYLLKNRKYAAFSAVGNVTVCTIPNPSRAGLSLVGISQCSPSDTYIPEIGKALALMRARKESQEVMDNLIK